MKSSIVLLFSALSILAAKFDYYGSLEYIFDSNVAQNYTEISGTYLVPSLGGKLKLSSIPLYFKTDLVYDAYLTERDFDDNSPFISGGTGIKLGSKKQYWRAEILVNLYIGMDAFSPRNPYQSRDWVPVLRTALWKNRFTAKRKRHLFSFDAEIELKEYGDEQSDTGVTRNGKNAVTVRTEPSYQFKFSMEKSIRVRTIGVIPSYEGNFAHASDESYDRFGCDLETRVSFWKADLNLSGGYDVKRFRDEEEHIHTGDMQQVTTHYFNVKSKLEIPIISDLSLYVAGKLRFRESNDPERAFNRHTASLGIIWDSSIPRNRNRKS